MRESECPSISSWPLQHRPHTPTPQPPPFSISCSLNLFFCSQGKSCKNESAAVMCFSPSAPVACCQSLDNTQEQLFFFFLKWVFVGCTLPLTVLFSVFVILAFFGGFLSAPYFNPLFILGFIPLCSCLCIPS